MSAAARWLLPSAASVMFLAPRLALAAGGDGHDEPALLSGPNVGLVTAVTTLVVFALLLAILGRFAWGPIAEGLRAREQRIRKEIADAEAARQRAEATLREYSQRLATAEAQVRQMLASASTDAEKIAADIRARGETEADSARQRATRDIDTAHKKAVADIYETAADISTAIAARILRRELNPEDQQDLVQQSLDQLEKAEV